MTNRSMPWPWREGVPTRLMTVSYVQAATVTRQMVTSDCGMDVLHKTLTNWPPAFVQVFGPLDRCRI